MGGHDLSKKGPKTRVRALVPRSTKLIPFPLLVAPHRAIWMMRALPGLTQRGTSADTWR